MNKNFLIVATFLSILNLAISATNNFTEGYFLKSLSVKFPAKISELELSAINDFEEKEKGLGVSLLYRGNGIKADIYVYNLGFNDIVDGVDSELAKMSFQRSNMDIEEMARRKIYNKLKCLNTENVKKIGTIDFLSKKYNYIESGTQKDSYLLLTCMKGNFIKIRLTYNVVADSDLSIVGEKFLHSLSDILHNASK